MASSCAWPVSPPQRVAACAPGLRRYTALYLVAWSPTLWSVGYALLQTPSEDAPGNLGTDEQVLRPNLQLFCLLGCRRDAPPLNTRCDCVLPVHAMAHVWMHVQLQLSIGPRSLQHEHE